MAVPTAHSLALSASGTDAAGGAHAAAGASAEPETARFEQLFRELAPYVLRVLPRMGVAEPDLDDVTQEVFLAVHRGLPAFEGRSSTRTWVYGICIRTCSNYRQRAHRRHEQLAATLPERCDARTPERALDASVALARLDAALAALPHEQRAVFVLYEIEQLAIAEIAQALGSSKFTLYARLYAARRAVRSAMRGHAEGSADDA